ncbi:ABC transporter ATP-binding protein [Gordonia neofelifaecis]|uniref:ABC transporter-like protein n=1 Tax=Gordonia neofelifaecis NRRL B-59395 TaxID=644548 RepID=F1YEN2_9ACTN|nr:ABC transporter ATP-binding protein [Gordonia neofelifaecis]EGD56865.1 ABC transporter-like protein [Gordonia neofelifaecis NRRL B-59395]
MLILNDVAVRYGRFEALRGVDWSVGTGQSTVTALLGPSGCGKSTLLRAIAGFEPLAAGTVSWDGEDLSGRPPHRRDFGVVFQDGQLFPGRTVAQNIAYGLARRGVRGAAAAERVATMLDLVQLGGFEDRPVGALSGGQAQRVALARALAPEPRLLLLDEPLAAIDSQLRESLAESIGTIVRAAGTPTVLVTHDHREAALMADTVSVMRAGRIVQTDSAERLWRRPADEETARFLGARAVVAGVVRSGVLITELGETDLRGRVGFDDLADGDCTVALRPEAVIVEPDPASPAVVEHAAALVAGRRARVRVGGDVFEGVSSVPISVGDHVRLGLAPGALAVVGR